MADKADDARARADAKFKQQEQRSREADEARAEQTARAKAIGRLSRSVLHIAAAATLLCTNNLQALGQDRTSPAELQVRGALELGIICSGCGVVPPVPRRGRKNSGAEPVSTPETAIADILNDPSLRPGDLVMFPDGLKVFQGGVAPYTRDRFQPASEVLDRPRERRPHGSSAGVAR